MKKIIKTYGNAVIIKFSPEEQKIYHLKEGDIIDITIIKEPTKKTRK